MNGSHTTDRIGVDGVGVAMEAIMFAGSPEPNADARVRTDGRQGGAGRIGVTDYPAVPGHIIGTTGRGPPVESFRFRAA